MRPTLARATLAAAVLLLAPGAAEADVAALHAEIQGGGAGGQGIDGELQDQAFHERTAGLTYGALVGVELLFIDAWIEHNQFVEGGEFVGTWTQFMTGLDFEFDLGDKKGGELKGQKKQGGYSAGYGEIGLAAGFGVGTLEQVDPPLDNSQVDDKGFLGQVSVGGGFRLTQLLSVGVRIPLQVGYMFKSGVPANIESNQYISVQGAALLNVRLKFELK